MPSDTTAGSVVLTGCGWVSPLAFGSIESVLSGALDVHNDRSANEPYLSVPDAWQAHTQAFSKEIQRDKGAWMAALALQQACDDASLDLSSLDLERTGLVLGCGLAGQLGMMNFASEVRQNTARFVSPIHFPQTVGNYISGALARGFGIKGPCMTLASGAASGLDAIIEACSLVASGAASVVLAGGVDQLTQETAQALGTEDAVPSDGAVLLVVEDSEHAANRGGRQLAEVRRWGEQNDADEPRNGDAICSTAGFWKGGAVCIESWVGRSLGSSGAAALAAGIGAANGCSVPVAEESAGDDVRTLIASDAAGERALLILAQSDEQHRSALEILVT